MAVPQGVRSLTIRAVTFPLDPRSLPAIAERLIALREASGGLNQAAFAARLGMGRTAWNNYEKGVRRISLDEAVKVARATGATLDYIYLGRTDGLPHALAVRLIELEAGKSSRRA